MKSNAQYNGGPVSAPGSVASDSSNPTPNDVLRHVLLLRHPLKDISAIDCPTCHLPRTLFICSPQIAGVVGALVYDIQMRNSDDYAIEIYSRETDQNKVSRCKRSQRLASTPATDGGHTSSEERSSRERKRWQALLRNLFDHMATTRTAKLGGGSMVGGEFQADESGPTEDRITSHIRLWRTAQMDKEAFLQVFPQLPGVLGERLFAAFDSDHNGVIDFDEFASGLAILASADLGQKLGFIFHMYDLNGDGKLSRDELAMMLYHIPSSLTFLSRGRRGKRTAPIRAPENDRLRTITTMKALATNRPADSDKIGESEPKPTGKAVTDIDIEELEALLKGIRTEESMREFEVMVDKLVEKAFEIYNGQTERKSDEMTFDTFCEAVLRFPELRLALEVFCQESIKPQSFMPIPRDVLLPKSDARRSLFPPLHQGRRQRDYLPASLEEEEDIPADWIAMECSQCGTGFWGLIGKNFANGSSFQTSRHLSAKMRRRPQTEAPTEEAFSKTESFVQTPSQPLPDLRTRFTHYPPCLSAHSHPVEYCGWLEKEGRRLGMRRRRFYALRNRFLYMYTSTQRRTPTEAIMIEGCQVDKLLDDPQGDLGRVAVAARRPVETPDVVEVEIEQPPKFERRWGFELKWHGFNGKRIVLYARTRCERDQWIKHLSQAAGVTESVFHDLYQLQGTLGAGKFATVYRALNKSTQEKVAVKILRKPTWNKRKLTPHPNATPSIPDEAKVDVESTQGRQHGMLGRLRCGGFRRCLPCVKRQNNQCNESGDDEDDLAVQRFQRTEVAVLQLLYHPNLVRLLDVYNTQHYLYIVMEWGPSGDLRRLIDTVQQINKGLRELHQLSDDNQAPAEDPSCSVWIPEWIAKEIVLGVLSGLTFLHSPKRNVIHRDLKPDNILLRLIIPQLKYPLQQLLPNLPVLPLFPDTPGSVDTGQVNRRSTRAKTQVKRIVVRGSGDSRAGVEWSPANSSRVRTLLATQQLPEASLPTIRVRHVDGEVPEVETEGLGDTTGDGSHIPNGPLEDSVDEVVDSDISRVENADEPTSEMSRSSLDTVDMYQGSGPYGGEEVNYEELNLDQGSPSPKALKGLLTNFSPVPLVQGPQRHSLSGECGAPHRRADTRPVNGFDGSAEKPPYTMPRSTRSSTEYAPGDGLSHGGRRGLTSFDNVFPVTSGGLAKRQKLAVELMNFWVFLHCLEWRDEYQSETSSNPKGYLRRNRRSQTHQPGGLTQARFSPEYNPELPAFLQNSEVIRKIRSAVERATLDIDKSLMCRIEKFLNSKVAKDAISPKVTDFGLSKIVGPPSIIPRDCKGGLTGYADEALGTAAYAAPEVVNGLKYTTSADIWSLGVVMYQLLSGGTFPLFEILMPTKRTSQISGGPEGELRPLSNLVDVKENYIPILKDHKIRLVFQPEAHWKRVSTRAKNLIQKLLDVNPQTRVTAKDALLDSWILGQ